MPIVQTYNNKKIAINTLLLILRSIISIGIALFASRVLLRKLGVDDYGLYFVVGGVVFMFNSLRSFFSSAIQRFLNYAKGQGDINLLNKIFNTGIEIQLALSLLLLILMETIGLVAVNNLNIPDGMYKTAHVIFQLSIFAAIMSMLTIPYDALIIANEKMNAYAFFSIIESLLKLGIIYLIDIGPFYKLLNYAILAFGVAVIMRFVNAAYCTKSFPESKHRWILDKQLLKKMGSFAGWNFLGNTGFSLTHEGINYILNLMGGVTINAARALVYQIMAALNTLIGNINVAFKPQTNASAADDDKTKFYELLAYNAKTTFSFYLIIMVPTVIFSQFAVKLWLGTVPSYVIPFIATVSVYHLLRTIHVPIDSFFISIGELSYYQISEICFQILNIPLAYLLLKIGMPYWSVFLGMCFVEIMNHISILSIATIKYKFPIRMFVNDVYIPFFILSFISVCIVYISRRIIPLESNNIILFISVGIIIEIVLVSSISFFALKQRERGLVFNTIKNKFKF